MERVNALRCIWRCGLGTLLGGMDSAAGCGDDDEFQEEVLPLLLRGVSLPVLGF